MSKDKQLMRNISPRLSEDWLAVIIAFALILLSVIGLLGPNGLMIKF